MQRSFVLLLAVCALASALPQNKRSAEVETVEREDPSTTVKPTSKSKLWTMESTDDLVTAVAASGDKLVVIFFMATWCPFSRRAVPIIENIVNTTDGIVVLKVDVDKKIDYEYTVSAVPTFVFLKNSKKFEVLEGIDEDQLKNIIQNLK